ncbi:hypothetical protein TTHERM_000361879 (macronuclear) [Tetrahymena thermophila SB210]|uniref:Uncharacterized protein n=1 Tax=Tetrahymena thermophila (strain SB210) TaxID=312017 RepID=W7XFE4_TETTS|nr:hypothetical protein TTHERM_000361879 [Tetrahymena thermophila SB210]EWS76542.1 hypothetical protein TTHERM_000361879 [Tetrahymena thermophila SB210]|eukprot:XP_012650914.1 hypothetical protein TTHERM_000361879 [Tetrahymena thermophila SB210]
MTQQNICNLLSDLIVIRRRHINQLFNQLRKNQQIYIQTYIQKLINSSINLKNQIINQITAIYIYLSNLLSIYHSKKTILKPISQLSVILVSQLDSKRQILFSKNKQINYSIFLKLQKSTFLSTQKQRMNFFKYLQADIFQGIQKLKKIDQDQKKYFHQARKYINKQIKEIKEIIVMHQKNNQINYKKSIKQIYQQIIKQVSLHKFVQYLLQKNNQLLILFIFFHLLSKQISLQQFLRYLFKELIQFIHPPYCLLFSQFLKYLSICQYQLQRF